MNLTDDYTLKFQCGAPVLFEDICAIYPATLRQIVEVGYSQFQSYLGVITMTKPPSNPKAEDKELNELLEQLTDFQYMLMMATIDKTINQLLKEAFQFFIHDSVMFSLEPAQIVIGPLEEKHLMTEDTFYDFQRIIKRMHFLEMEGEEIIISKNDSPQIKALKMKMRENREKVRRAKASKAAQEKSDLKMSDLIGSITINNCGLNMANIWDITYYAFHDQLKRMGWRDQFDINNRAALAGAKIKKKDLKHWMRSISNDEK